jgi:aspartyl-tRNA(Asn)/glutamyl-tRNA(Gln) amidotransferase subunit C
MSKITKKDLEKISKLSQIEIKAEEENQIVSDLTKITDWFENLSEVNTKNIDFLGNVHEQNLTLHEDKINLSNSKEDILQNSKNVKYGYFAVPKVIEKN